MNRDAIDAAPTPDLPRRIGMTFMLAAGLALSSTGGCAGASGLEDDGALGEDVVQSESTLPVDVTGPDGPTSGTEQVAQSESALVPVAVVRLANANEYRFMGVADELGELTEIGVMEMGHAGSASLHSVDAQELNPLELFLGLTGVEREVPTALLDLYQAGAPVVRGWIAEAIEGARVTKALDGCSDQAFLARFGDLQSGYEHHAGPDQGCWLNSSWYNFAWQASAKRVHVGVCTQKVSDYTRVTFKHRALGSDDWNIVYENHYVPQGWYLHWSWHSSSHRLYRLEIDPFNVAGTFDIGFDYDD